MATEDVNKRIDSLLDGLAIIAAFADNLARVGASIKAQQDEDRDQTPEELAAEQLLTAQKRALAEAS